MSPPCCRHDVRHAWGQGHATRGQALSEVGGHGASRKAEQALALDNDTALILGGDVVGASQVHHKGLALGLQPECGGEDGGECGGVPGAFGM